MNDNMDKRLQAIRNKINGKEDEQLYPLEETLDVIPMDDRQAVLQQFAKDSQASFDLCIEHWDKVLCAGFVMVIDVDGEEQMGTVELVGDTSLAVSVILDRAISSMGGN